MSKTIKISSKKSRATKKMTKKRSGNVPEWGSLSCKRTINPTAGGSYTVNTLYSNMTTCLNQFPRALFLANAYQHYRIKNIKMTWLPQFDTFGASGGTGSKPNLYYMIDKSGSVPTNVSLEGLKNMGAKPVALDEKPVVRSWKPSVLEGALQISGAIQASKYKLSPWLSVDNTPITPAFQASLINHLGIYWYVDQAEASATAYNYKVEVEVQLEFKKPLVNGMTSAVQAVGSVPVELNHSPDGLVGGIDEAPSL